MRIGGRTLVTFTLGVLAFAGRDVWAQVAPLPVPTSATMAATSATVAVAGAPTSAALAVAAEALKWLGALEERHKDYRRARGEFTQTKKDPVFLEEIAGSGEFYYERPNRFRCDYDKPEESTSLVDGDLVTLYFPKLKQLERYRLSRQSGGIGEVNQMLLAFGIETSKVLKYFTVACDPKTSANIVRLIFTPKAPRQERPFAQFLLEVSKPDLTPKRFEIVGDEGDRTLVTVTKITWNSPLPPDIFRLNPPKDVEIIEQE
jgi:outer membrane lipoprotein carrier protein